MSRHNNTLAHRAFASQDFSTVQRWETCPNLRDRIALFCDGSSLLVPGDWSPK